MRINDRSQTDFDRAKIKLIGHFDRRPTGRYFEPCMVLYGIWCGMEYGAVYGVWCGMVYGVVWSMVWCCMVSDGVE